MYYLSKENCLKDLFEQVDKPHMADKCRQAITFIVKINGNANNSRNDINPVFLIV